MFLGAAMVLQLDIPGCDSGTASCATMFVCCDTAQDEECEGEDTVW